ncbi:MAG: M23 family metallopeptidase [Lachnospiraceae bacterium]|nr:M23 family metallopeptidase [Lachnospiraceae bacterium]
MKKISKYHVKFRVTELKVLIGTLFVALFFLPNFRMLETGEDNRFTVYLFGECVGVTDDSGKIDRFLTEARRQLAGESRDLFLIDGIDLKVEGSEVFWGNADSDATITENIKQVLSAHRKTLKPSYTVKVNTQTVTLSTADEVRTMLADAVAKYDTEGRYTLSMNFDKDRELKVLTPAIERTGKDRTDIDLSSGVENIFDSLNDSAEELENKGFDDYELGISSVSFSEDVEVVESYVNEDEISTLEDACSILTEEQEVQQIYEVKAGDTLSEISLNVGIPMETIVEMNSDYLDDVNSTLHVGQQLVITVPEPELSVEYTIRDHYEESYEAEIVYVDNDSWYTTQKVTLQEPSAGYREVIADVNYVNGEQVSKNVVKEDILMEAVPKIVERGTIIPPTYIKPISGGRMSSGFGKRKAPKAGASTYHKGIDWATPIGTPVYASSGGVVAKAGWGSGYGYVVYINHPDGRQTRYGHLSKIYVSVGQSVSQSDKIALSGNSGVSTGPHIHFEILINGSQVNPLNYLN